MGEVIEFINVCLFSRKYELNLHVERISYRKRAHIRVQTRTCGAWYVLPFCSLASSDQSVKMFEFCQSVKPSLEDYEADGVCLSFFLPDLDMMNHFYDCRRGLRYWTILHYGKEVK